MFMPFSAAAQGGGHGTASHGISYQERSSGTMAGSHMNMIPIARSVQSIHGIGPNLANQKALQPAADREQAEYRRNAQISDKDNYHLSSLNHNPASNRVDTGKARQFPARAVMQVEHFRVFFAIYCFGFQSCFSHEVLVR